MEDHLMEIRVIGIDLGKSVFHLVGMDQRGKVVARKRLSRSQMMVYTAKLPSCLIGMEASCGGHFLGAALTAQGHDVRLMPAHSLPASVAVTALPPMVM
jgi:transposase